MKFQTQIVNGKVSNKEIGEYIRLLKDGKYTVEIKKAGTRSSLQNSYYWLILGLFAFELGYSPEQLHYILKGKYLLRTTTILNKSDFGEYIEFVKDTAGELGILLPDPQY